MKEVKKYYKIGKCTVFRYVPKWFTRDIHAFTIWNNATATHYAGYKDADGNWDKGGFATVSLGDEGTKAILDESKPDFIIEFPCPLGDIQNGKYPILESLFNKWLETNETESSRLWYNDGLSFVTPRIFGTAIIRYDDDTLERINAAFSDKFKDLIGGFTDNKEVQEALIKKYGYFLNGYNFGNGITDRCGGCYFFVVSVRNFITALTRENEVPSVFYKSIR